MWWIRSSSSSHHVIWQAIIPYSLAVSCDQDMIGWDDVLVNFFLLRSRLIDAQIFLRFALMGLWGICSRPGHASDLNRLKQPRSATCREALCAELRISLGRTSWWGDGRQDYARRRYRGECTSMHVRHAHGQEIHEHSQMEENTSLQICDKIVNMKRINKNNRKK